MKKKLGNDILEFQKNADVEDMLMPDVSRILVIYTGGTIGMKHNVETGYEPVPNYLSETLAGLTRFNDPQGLFQAVNGRSRSHSFNNSSPISRTNSHTNLEFSSSFNQNLQYNKESSYSNSSLNWLITPPSLYGKRIRYAIKEYPLLLDSCNITMSDWVRIATDIEDSYQRFDAFIVLHGTDTMAYTASALSFMLENLGKTVIITGSQVPISEVRNDAIENLLGALTIAGHFVIPEVSLYFGNKLFRGNRCSKVSAIDFEAFDSPNLRPLVQVGVNIEVNWAQVLKPNTISRFQAQKSMNPNVASLRLFPGITHLTVIAFLSQNISGVVLETFGSGNIPDQPELIRALKKASEQGTVIVNCSQCPKGTVSDIYASSRGLFEANVVPGSDMTAECALTKLSYLLAKGLSPEEVRKRMRQNLRGELSGKLVDPESDALYELESELSSMTPLQTLAIEMTELNITKQKLGDERGIEAKAAKTLLPLLLCSAAAANDIDCFRLLQKTQGDSFQLSCADYAGRSPLHIASSHGCFEAVEFLLKNGAVVHLLDREGHTPLFYAARHRHGTVIKLLVTAGAHFNRTEVSAVTSIFLRSAANGSFTVLKHFLDSGLDVNIAGLDGRTALHLAAANGHEQTVKFLCNVSGISLDKTDNWGRTALEDIKLQLESEQHHKNELIKVALILEQQS